MLITIPLSIIIGIFIGASAVLGFGLYHFISDGLYIFPFICGILIVALIVIGAYLCR